MICKVSTATTRGIEACTVVVETDVGDGLPAFDMVGLPSSEVREARERVRSAIKNSGYVIPPKRITINLSPADIRKSGTFFDIPIAISILACLGIVPNELIKKCMFAGELSLSGQAVRVNGILPIVLQAIEEGYEYCFIPTDNLDECMMISGIKIVGVDSLAKLVYMLVTKDFENIKINEDNITDADDYIYDFSDVKGQPMARRAAEITAAGMHNMLMIGTPGAGKTMIARCMPSIMPELSKDEQLEVAKIHSVAGIWNGKNTLTRPFRNPHHTASRVALTGGGNNPKPGEMSLAHKGVLFLDELPEFSRMAIEVLRQPLEERCIAISRAGGKYVFPADFVFVAASNPCRCGYYPDRNKCKCTEQDVRKYREKISGPIMDRIDMCVGIEPVTYEELNSDVKAESSTEIKKRVEQAVEIQRERYKKCEISFNGQLDGRNIKEFCRLGHKEQQVMEQAFEKMNLSVRSHNKIIKVARTIADLEGVKDIEVKHLAEAMGYRLSV